jgi:CxxC motif-containing protein
MIKKMICIECPVGCVLEADMDSKPIRITGNECPKGENYAISEIENPQRILTSSVLTQGLALKMVPIKTDRPILKKDLLKAMEGIKKIRLRKTVAVGDIVAKDLLGLGVNLVATRECL